MNFILTVLFKKKKSCPEEVFQDSSITKP